MAKPEKSDILNKLAIKQTITDGAPFGNGRAAEKIVSHIDQL